MKLSKKIPTFITNLNSFNKQTKQKALRKLGYLAANNPENQDLIREAGGIPWILDAWRDLATRYEALKTLECLAYNNPKNQAAIQAEQKIWTLLVPLAEMRTRGVGNQASIKARAQTLLSILEIDFIEEQFIEDIHNHLNEMEQLIKASKQGVTLFPSKGTTQDGNQKLNSGPARFIM